MCRHININININNLRKRVGRCRAYFGLIEKKIKKNSTLNVEINITFCNVANKDWQATKQFLKVEQNIMSEKFTRFLPLHGKDYRGDTAHLTLEQHGSYLLLLIEQWDKGDILLDDKNLNRIFMGSERTDAVQAVIEEFFKREDHGDSVTISNSRLSKERKHAQTIYERKVGAARRVSAGRTKRVDPTQTDNSLHKVKKNIDSGSTLSASAINTSADIKQDVPSMGYIFAGEVIKLNEADYLKFKSLYSFIDLDHHLRLFDADFANKQPSGGKWYQPLLFKLEYQNKLASAAQSSPVNKKQQMRGAI